MAGHTLVQRCTNVVGSHQLANRRRECLQNEGDRAITSRADAAQFAIAVIAIGPSTPAVAVAVCGPVAGPSVQRTVTSPSELVTADCGEMLPPPLVMAKPIVWLGIGTLDPPVTRNTIWTVYAAPALPV